jgi:hypothetical protein
MDSINTSAMQGLILKDHSEMRKKVESDPSFVRLQESLRVKEREEKEIDRVLQLPRDERLEHMRNYNTDLYNAIGLREFQKHKQMSFIMGFPVSALLVAAGIGATLLGALPSVLTPMIGFMGAVAGPATSLLSIKAAKKWVIPGKIDGVYRREMKERRETLESEIKNAQERKNSIEQSLTEAALKDELEAQKREAIMKELNRQTIDDDGEFVDVAGIRLPKNGLMEYNFATITPKMCAARP